jgi:hypothetical protein
MMVLLRKIREAEKDRFEQGKKSWMDGLNPSL